MAGAEGKRGGSSGGPQNELAWWWATLGVTPLPGRARPEAPRPAPARPAAKPAGAAGERTAKATPRAPEGPALVPGKAAGLDRRSLRRLRRGEFPIAETLDLHGMTRATAHGALGDLIARRRADRACVLVVTGKGGHGEQSGVLRRLLPRWLNEPANRARVLAFAPALPRDGGDGAFYVLLRRRT
jgi:DNA-nicking Smr family endonuclease